MYLYIYILSKKEPINNVVSNHLSSNFQIFNNMFFLKLHWTLFYVSKTIQLMSFIISKTYSLDNRLSDIM